jgi:hypothetical protein
MIGTLVHLVVYLLVVGLIVWLLLWLIDFIPLPEPFHKVARIVIFVLLGLVGEAPRLRLTEIGGVLLC